MGKAVRELAPDLAICTTQCYARPQQSRSPQSLEEQPIFTLDCMRELFQLYLDALYRVARGRYLSYIGSLFGVDFPDRRVAVRGYDQRVSMLPAVRRICATDKMLYVSTSSCPHIYSAYVLLKM